MLLEILIIESIDISHIDRRRSVLALRTSPDIHQSPRPFTPGLTSKIMSSSNRESKEDDVVEMKKALATGSLQQENAPTSSSLSYIYICTRISLNS